MSRPLIGDYPPDIHASTLQAAQDCESRGRHEWHLYDEGETAPHFWCACWNRAEITDPYPDHRTIPSAAWHRYAGKWASEGCDFCESMRESCKSPQDHFSAEHLEPPPLNIPHPLIT